MKLRTIFISSIAVVLAASGSSLSSIVLAGPTGSDGKIPGTPQLRMNVFRSCPSSCPQDVNLSWSESGGATSYQLYRNGLSLKTFSTSASLAYTDQFTGTGVTYSYKVKALNSYGAATSNTVSYTTDEIVPTTPSNLTAQPTLINGLDVIHLQWNAATDNFGVAKYEITRINHGNGNSVATFSVPGSQTFYDNATGGATSPDMSLTYVVRALDKAGNISPPSNIALVGKDITSPSMPTNLRATLVTVADRYGVRLQWSPSTDNVGVDHYVISRKNLLIPAFMDFTVPGNQTTYDDLFFKIDAGGLFNYSYTVQAVDAAGNFSAPALDVIVTSDSSRPSEPRPWFSPSD